MSDLLPFQQATVDAACRALLHPSGMRRFLVADEVGLGKTRVAREAIRRLVETTRGVVDVLYVCSSQAISAQNLSALQKAVAEGQCTRPAVDRLTLWPSQDQSKKVDAKIRLRLIAFTPGTSFDLRSSLGTWRERRFILKVLDGYRGWNGRYVDAFRGGVSEDNWAWRLAEDVCIPTDVGFGVLVRRGVAAEFPGTSLEDGLASPAGRPQVIGRLRQVFATVALEFLSPALVIFDEFQRFQKLLAEAAHEGATTKEQRAHELTSRLLRGREDGRDRPGVLLLSATPYRLYSDDSETFTDPEGTHYNELFALLKFLFGAAEPVAAIRKDFARYRELLPAALFGQADALHDVRRRLTRRLASVVARTERVVHEHGDDQVEDVARDLAPGEGLAPLDELDIAGWRHACAGLKHAEDHAEITRYWASIPYPLQMLHGYQLREKDRLIMPRRRGPSGLVLDAEAPARPRKVPNAKYRAFAASFPPETLALPWLAPTLPWWNAAGPWRNAPASKVLVFSRWRGVPRALSVLLSRDVEAACTRGEVVGAGTRLDFVVKRGGQSNRGPLFRLFHPSPWLAQAVDPREIAASLRDGGAPSYDAVRKRARHALKRALRELGVAIGRPCMPARSRWKLLPVLDRMAGMFGPVLASWQQVAVRRQGVSVHVSVLAEAATAVVTTVSSGELDWLVETALASPAVTLLRAISRRFPDARDAVLVARLRRVIEITYGGFGHLMDLTWQRALVEREYSHVEGGYHDRVLASARDGNLESVWDEFLWIMARLGGGDDAERAVLERLQMALDLPVVQASVDRDPGDRKSPIRMRRHVAQAFLLDGADAVESRSRDGEEGRPFHPDALRAAFNAPFWPHVLATTSVGQEGLDFHVYCDQIVHWNLPSNPVDLEQREGRLQRYGSLAVRKAVAGDQATSHECAGLWDEMFAAAGRGDGTGLCPWWVYPGAKIRRWVLSSPFSEETERYRKLRRTLVLYRLALGQPDQEDLLTLLGQVDTSGDEGLLRKVVRELRIDLAPLSHAAVRLRAGP